MSAARPAPQPKKPKRGDQSSVPSGRSVQPEPRRTRSSSNRPSPARSPTHVYGSSVPLAEDDEFGDDAASTSSSFAPASNSSPRPDTPPNPRPATPPPRRQAAASGQSVRFALPRAQQRSAPRESVLQPQETSRSDLRTAGKQSELEKQSLFREQRQNERLRGRILEEEVKQASIKTKREALEFFYRKRKLEQELGESLPVDLDLDMI